MSSLKQVNTKGDLPPFTEIIDLRSIDVDFNTSQSDQMLLLRSELDQKTGFFLVTEKIVKEGVIFPVTKEIKSSGLNLELYSATAEFIELLKDTEISNAEVNSEKAKAEQQARNFIQGALDARASDIHFQVDEQVAKILYRIDGDLSVRHEMSSDAMRTFLETHYTSFSRDRQETGWTDKSPLSSTAKDKYVLSKPYIKTEHEFKPHEVVVNLRKQSLPNQELSFDEVWRLLVIDEDSPPPTFNQLGYSENHIDILRRVLRRPKGIVLICGQTGSGKTVTMASSLHQIALMHRGTKSIRTVENPVEMYIPGVRQRSIARPEDFADAIRTFMRADPDVMGVGEIRDSESAKASADGALTGHPVIATMHSGTPVNAIKRLRDLGVDSLTLAEDGFLNLIIIQKLVQSLCQHCKLPIKQSKDRFIHADPKEAVSDFLFEELALSGLNIDDVYGRGEGCSHCGGRGHTGRRAIACMAEIEAKHRRAIEAEQSLEPFFVDTPTELDHALDLLKQGLVSPKAVLDVCGTLSSEAYRA